MNPWPRSEGPWDSHFRNKASWKSWHAFNLSSTTVKVQKKDFIHLYFMNILLITPYCLDPWPGGGDGFHNLWRESHGHHNHVIRSKEKIFVYSIHTVWPFWPLFYVLNPWRGVIIKIHHLSSGLQEHHKHPFSFSPTTAEVERENSLQFYYMAILAPL